MREIRIGDRVVITDRGDKHYGKWATVTRGEHPGILTGRPMIEAYVDGSEEIYADGYYVEQVDLALEAA